MHIPEYTQGTWTNHEPRRIRKLLLKRVEIDKLHGQAPRERPHPGAAVASTSTTAGPRSSSAWRRARSAYDKRQDLANRDAHREIARAMGRRRKGMS